MASRWANTGETVSLIGTVLIIGALAYPAKKNILHMLLILTRLKEL